MKIKQLFWVVGFMTVLLIAPGFISAQTDTTAKKRLRIPATAKGFVGGESHDSYVVRARKGQTMTVQISWRRKDDNRAEFTVSRSANFFNSAPVKFGKESDRGKRWSGRIPQTGNYYIYVVANPTADYTIRVAARTVNAR